MITIPDNFQPLSIPLPPMLLQMAGVEGDSRFVSLYYSGSKATWNDGRSIATFPFYTVWQPYTEHLAIAIELFNCDLGSDDTQATHALVCDAGYGGRSHRTQEKVYASPFAEAMSFLDEQHPPRQRITQEQREKIKAQLENWPPLSISQMQDLGTSKLFAPNPEHKDKAIELIRWLDRYIDESLMRRYLEAASNGESRAAWMLEMFVKRRQQ